MEGYKKHHASSQSLSLAFLVNWRHNRTMGLSGRDDQVAWEKFAEEQATTENAEAWVNWSFLEADFLRRWIIRSIGHSFIKSLLPRPAGFKDSLTFTVIMKGLPNTRLNMATSLLVGLVGSFACYSTGFLLVFGAGMLHSNIAALLLSTKRVASWLPLAWGNIVFCSTVSVPLYPILHLLPSQLAQDRYKGISPFIREELLGNWKTHLSLALFSVPFSLLIDNEEFEQYCSERFFALDDEEDDEDLWWEKRLKRTAFHLVHSSLISLLVIPSEVIIAHVLSGEEKYNTLSKCVSSLWMEGGLLAFYRGAFPLFFAFACMSAPLYSIWR